MKLPWGPRVVATPGDTPICSTGGGLCQEKFTLFAADGKTPAEGPERLAVWLFVKPGRLAERTQSIVAQRRGRVAGEKSGFLTMLFFHPAKMVVKHDRENMPVCERIPSCGG